MPETLSRQPAVAAVLNRLFHLLTRSLPMYLEDAKPWSGGEDAETLAALDRLVADQHMLAGRVAEAIVANGGQPAPGPFPIEFTSLNDVAFDFLLRRILERLRCEVAETERCMVDLAGDPPARELAEEVLGNAQGHLDVLQSMKDEG
jgi:hypothetical protein